ncbi:hyalin-like isoform X5 [Acanthaster planci]|uniref:Hyalin-like isoform X5 n=1 Tax=Acanthaster planci TaxID=133434 RepID=A0A8B7ZQN3_ACAPL|nr:hyalin-like isoform X5 [Acanthaster planci]
MVATFGVTVVCALSVLLPTPILSQGGCRCENGGTCLYDPSGAGIRCACPTGYRGILCDIQDVNCRCENGGVCRISAQNGYECSCQEGYDGLLCQYIPLVDDKLPPEIFNCPSDFEARRQAGEDAVFVTWVEPYATDNSGRAPSVARNVAPNFYAQSNYDFQVVYTYTDQSGLSSECRFTVTVVYSDVIEPRPIFSGCPADINVTATDSLRAVVNWLEPMPAAVSQEVIRVDRSHAPGSIFFLGSTLVTYIFTGEASQVQSMCTFTVNVITDACQCENGGTCVPDNTMTGVRCMCRAGYSGILCQRRTCLCQNSGICQYEPSSNAVSCLCPRGYRGVLCEQTDDRCDCENGGTCVHDTVIPGGTMCICPSGFSGILCNASTTVDTSPPTITFCPASFTIIINPTSSDAVAATWPQPQAEDDSGTPPSVDQNVPVGTVVNVGDIFDVVYKFTDAAGNAAFCNFTITVLAPVDTSPPTITFCPASFTINPTSSDPVAATWPQPQAEDDSGTPPSVDQNVPVGTLVNVGNVLNVMYKFTDAAGNVASCNFTITVLAPVDTSPPTITFCPASFTINPTSSDPVAATWPQPQAEDDSGTPPSVDQNVPVGTLVNVGDILEVVYKFTDAAGNIAFCNFTVTVLAPVDTSPPTITFCPASFTINPTSRDPVAATWLQPQAEDDAGTPPSVDQNVPVGTLVNVGDILDVVYKFTDAAGNIAFCNFTVTVLAPVDTSPPTITFCPASFTINPTSSDPVAAIWPQPQAEDDSGTPPSVDQNVPVGTLVNVGDILDVVYKFTDAAGNVAFCNFTVTAVDNIPPTIIFCPPDIENMAPTPEAMIFVTWAMPQVSDNSGGSIRVVASALPGLFVMAGTMQAVSYVFTDESGNQATCTFNIIITVLDPPKGISVVNVTTTAATLALDPPSVNFDSYIVKVEEQELTVPAAESSVTLSDLMPGTSYKVSVVSAIIYAPDDVVTSRAISLEFTTVPLDVTAPVISGCPSDITLPAGQNVANWTEPTAVDDSGLDLAVSKSHEPGAVFADESTNVTYTFTDATGNVAKCVFSVKRILVLEPPTSVSLINVTTTSVLLAVLPPNATFDNYVVNVQGPVLTVDVSIPAMESILNIPGLMTGTNYTVSVSTAVALGTENEVVSEPVSLNFTTVPLDLMAPVISGCPSDITLPAGQNVANWTEPTAVDDSGLVPVVSKSHEPGAVFADELTNVTYTFTDAADNTAECVFIVKRILVLEPPVSFSLISVTTTSAMFALVPPNVTFDTYLVEVQGQVSMDNVSIPSTENTLSLPGLMPGNNYTVSVSTAVALGTENEVVSEPVSLDFTTETLDTTGPVISGCPSDITLPAGQNVANWTEPTAVDDSGLVPTVSKSHEPGAVFADELTNVTYMFTDAAGNTAECVFIVKRILVLEPLVSVSLINVTTTSALFVLVPPNVTFDTYVVKVQGQVLTVDVSIPSTESVLNIPGLIPGNNYTVSVSTAVALGTENEVVSEPVSLDFTTVPLDVTAPVISGCPSDISLRVGQNVANWTEPTAVDDSGLVPAVSKSHEPGAVFADGSTNVTYTFTDAAGNTAECVFTVRVSTDVTPPVISNCPADITLPLGITVADWTEPMATDDSGALPSILKSHEPGDSFPVGDTTVTYTFTDGAGNQANCTFLVTVAVDTIPPVISNCPADILLPLASTLANWTEPTATDNLGQPLSVTKTHEAGTDFPEGNTTVLYTFTDAAGNQANCSFIVTVVVDSVAPLVMNCPSNISIPFGNDTASWTEPTATDNSGQAPSVASSHQPGADFTDDVTLVTYTFTDISGNQANCVFFVIRLQDDISPVVSGCPGVINLPPGTNVASWDEPTATDNSGQVPTVTKTHESGNVFTENVTMVVYTFTDAAGNEALCIFFVKLAPVDDIPPVIVDCPSDMNVTLPLTQLGGVVVSWVEPSATDSSGVVPSVDRTHQPRQVFPEGATTVTYTFSDSSGNEAVCSFVISVEREEDVIPPVIVNCPPDQAYVIPAGNQFMIITWNPPSAIDNSGVQPTVESNRIPGDVFAEGTTVVMYNFTDPAGNSATCEFNITLSTPVLNPCQSNPCRSNENCFYSATDFICVPGPFRKKREVLDMKDGTVDICPCKNGGSCVREALLDGTQCICPEGFTGILCQEGGHAKETHQQVSPELVLVTSLPALVFLCLMLVAVYQLKRLEKNKPSHDMRIVVL